MVLWAAAHEDTDNQALIRQIQKDKEQFWPQCDTLAGKTCFFLITPPLGSRKLHKRSSFVVQPASINERARSFCFVRPSRLFQDRIYLG